LIVEDTGERWCRRARENVEVRPLASKPGVASSLLIGPPVERAGAVALDALKD
jgi:hypothetical protein